MQRGERRHCKRLQPGRGDGIVRPHACQEGSRTKAHPTLKDVARQAGVSEATASRALHLRPGTIPVHADTRERVRRIARDLGYRANHLARGLSRNYTDTLGVLLPFDAANIGRPYNSMILAGVAEAASGRGYALALYYADGRARADYAGAMRDGRVDGGLVVDSAVIASDQIARLEEERFPLVLVGHRLPETRTSFVSADDRDSAASVVRYLLGLGHRRIVHVHFAGGHPTRQRRLGFIDAMAAAGLDAAEAVVEDTIGDLPDRLDHAPLVRDLLGRRGPPDRDLRLERHRRGLDRPVRDRDGRCACRPTSRWSGSTTS